MADEADFGNDLAESDRQYKESEIRRKASVLEAEATGFCLCCAEDIFEMGRRWCDSECRDLWEAAR